MRAARPIVVQPEDVLAAVAVGVDVARRDASAASSRP
jgi:hypothetical protein